MERMKRMMDDGGFNAIEFEVILFHYQDKPALVLYRLLKGRRLSV